MKKLVGVSYGEFYRVRFIDNVATCSYIHIMKTVGIRELKNNLSEHLRDVRRGETVLVTDRGNVIAEIAPPGYVRSDPAVPAGLAALARRGLISLGSGGKPVYEALPRKHRGKAGARQLLDEERGSR